MNTFGEQLKLSIFGESHGNGIGIVVDGLPPGLAVDEAFIASELARRAPGNSPLATPRKEADQVEILSGVFNGYTTGAPLCGMIRNTNTRSKDYTPELPRPGHADLTAHIKYKGFTDHRGGGHFSGRLTAPLVFAGALCKSLLANNDIHVEAMITEIAGISGNGLTEAMEAAILQARADGDSMGGIIQCIGKNLPAGLGSPFFGSVESRLASMLYSIPAVKAVEFGDGVELTIMRGSEANDAIIKSAEGAVAAGYETKTNHNGGINGGITNGMDVVFRVGIKPTPSISKPQETVNLITGEPAVLEIHGRHDPCIVPRAVCVVEAAAAIVFADLLLCQWSDGVRKDR